MDKPNYDTMVEKASAWATGGAKALELAADTEYANATNGALPPNTSRNRAITISSAVKMFFDGLIADPNIKEVMTQAGLDMKDLRSSIVEKTLAHALPAIINSGDIERLARLGMLGGEKIDPGASGNGVVYKYVTPDENKAADEHIDAIINNK